MLFPFTRQGFGFRIRSCLYHWRPTVIRLIKFKVDKSCPFYLDHFHGDVCSLGFWNKETWTVMHSRAARNTWKDTFFTLFWKQRLKDEQLKYQRRRRTNEIFKLRQICEQFNMKISTVETKVLTFRDKEPERKTLIINDQIIEDVRHFAHVGVMLAMTKITMEILG